MVVAALATACADGETGESLGPHDGTPSLFQRVHLLASSRSPQIEINQTIQLETETTTEPEEPYGVEWSATGGTIDSTGAFTAAAAGVYTVYVRGRKHRNSIDSTAVYVTPPTLIALVITPGNALLPPGGKQAFTASGRLKGGMTVKVAPTWSATGGTIDSSGMYTAPQRTGSYLVIGTSTKGVADSSVVAVEGDTPGTTITRVVVTPGSDTLPPGATQAFTTSAVLSDGSTGPVATSYSATGGTVNSAGLYTAGKTPGRYRLVASALDGKADTAAITITDPPLTIAQLVLTPATASLPVGGTQQFTAAAKMSDGSTSAVPVTYNVTGGSVSSEGLYTAGQATGTFRVIATASGGEADTASVTITAAAPVLQRVVLTPASVSLVSGATQQFAVAGKMTDGTTTPVSVTYAATGGTITAAGLYTAGQTAGGFRVVATVTDGTLADTAAVTITAPTPTTGEPARMADSMADAAGVNVHLFYSGVYRNNWSSVVVPKLAALGVRHLRDHALRPSDGNAGLMTDHLRTLAEQGTKALLIFDNRYCTPDQCQTFTRNLGAGVAEAVEGWNEPDRRFSRTDFGWVTDSLKPYVVATWNAIKDDPATQDLKVCSPSIEFGATATAIGDIGRWIECGSIHPYPTWPNYPTYVDRVKAYKTALAPAYPSNPWWTTEASYHTGGDGSDRPVSELAQAKYGLRMLVEYYLRAQQRVYFYELLDQGTSPTNREQHFGLIRYDGSPKPLYTALSRFQGLVADPGPAFTPQHLEYSLSGDLGAVHRLLLQKRDGHFQLLLWQEVKSYDASAGDLDVAPNDVTLNLATSASVTVTNPRTGAVTRTSGRSVPLSVPDEVLVVDIAP
jgi:hypothetical protein